MRNIHLWQPDRDDIDRLVKDSLERLREEASPVCCATFPIVSEGTETRQNPIRWKNAVRCLEELLSRERGSEALDRRITDMQIDSGDWRDLQSFDGLWIGCFADRAAAVGLHHSPPARCQVGRLTPLRDVIQDYVGDTAALVLTLTLDRARPLLVRRDSVEEVDVSGFPVDFLDVVGHEREPQTLQHHNAGNETRFHGQGINVDDEGPEIARYLRVVEERLSKLSRHTNLPLFLAGVTQLTTAFENLSQRSVAGAIDGSPSALSDQELATLVRSRIAEQTAEWMFEIFDAQSTGSTARLTRAVDIAEAAQQGRLGALYLRGDDPIWVREAARVDCLSKQSLDDESAVPMGVMDLADFTLQNAWSTGAEIQWFEVDDRPAAMVGETRY